MNRAKTPRSLRSNAAMNSAGGKSDNSGRKVSAVAGLMAVATVSGAEAQQAPLPPVTVEAPVARPRPLASRPTPDQIRARNALRRAARRTQPTQAAPVPFPNAGALSADRDPYADAAAPYKVDHLQASGKFPEPLLNTPKTVTVLSKEVLEDKNATTLKQAILSTAGVTLGTGEGGNAFGDRFFIRGFDARNDVFIDGVRDSGVSVRENFFTEQVEILRGPGSSFAGRGTTGGAINIVTKQATTEKSFYNMDTTFGTDQTRRVQLDVNQVISPTLAIRAGGVFQDAGVAGRSYTTDDRDGGFVALTWKPVDAVKVTADYVHTDLHGLPDFGVPYFRPGSTGSGSQQFTSTAGGPFPSFGVNRDNFYGFVNRDFFQVRQDIGTVNGEVHITPDLVLTDKVRASRSLLNYVGTIPESPNVTNPNPALWTISANPQSRYQVTDVLANQTEATYKFGLNGWNHTTLAGVEISRETSYIDKYSGLSSEAIGTPSAGAGSVTQSIFSPQFTFDPFSAPTLMGLPTNIAIDTKSVYLLDTANYNDFIILNGGIRYDDYGINVNGYGTGAAAGVFGSQSAQFGLPNFNLGIVVKPLPIASVYAAYATSSDPVGSEFDGTSANYGGLSPVLNGGTNQIFGPEKNQAAEVGTKWELFNRHLLVTAALFQTEKENARESRKHHRRDRDRRLPISHHRARGQHGTLHQRRRRLSHPGDRPRCQRQGYRQMEPVRRNRPDAVGGDEIAGSFAAAAALSQQCRPPACQRRAPILQPAQQVPVDGHVGARRTGGLPLEDLRRYLARRQPGHVAAELLAFRCVRRGQDRQELAGEIVRQQHLQQALLRRLVSKRDAVRAGGARPHRIPGHLSEVLTTMPC